MAGKLIAFAAAVLASGLLHAGIATAHAAPGDGPAQKLRDPSRVLVIAHRGCVGEVPEVSVASVHACAGKGIDGIELDIRKSSDGVLVAIHDATLDRTTNGTGRVADHTAEELRALRLRRGNGGPGVVVTAEHLPTLEEMLLAAREHGFIVHLDIKDATHAEVAAVVEKLGMQGQGIAWVTGSPDDAHQPDPADVRSLAIVARIQDCPEGAPASCRANDMQDLMGFARYDPVGYFLWYRATPEFFDAFNAAQRPQGTRLTTETLWEIDNLPTAQWHAEIRRLLDAGATMFLTDRPGEMVEFLSTAVASPRPEVIAHRGGALLWPENTIHAFEQAVGAGVEYLEFDLQLTADNELLVTHDHNINPAFCSAPEGEGLSPRPVRVLTLEQARRFDCGSRSRDIYPDAEKRAAGMPALEEVFRAFSGNPHIKYFIETKLPADGAPGEPIDPTLYAAKLDQLVRKYGLEDRVVLQSFDWRTLVAMRELNPHVRTCPLGVPRNSHDYGAVVRELGAGCIVLSARETTPAQIREFQRDGVLVFSGVVDSEDDWRQAVEFGYDAIFTNDPVGVIRFLDAYGSEG